MMTTANAFAPLPHHNEMRTLTTKNKLIKHKRKSHQSVIFRLVTSLSFRH